MCLAWEEECDPATVAAAAAGADAAPPILDISVSLRSKSRPMRSKPDAAVRLTNFGRGRRDEKGEERRREKENKEGRKRKKREERGNGGGSLCQRFNNT